MDYINRNILSDITIDEICSAVHMSKYYFCRKFKESMGMTVMDYVLQTRIVLAKSILAKESMSITNVSEHCCFSSVSYFCRVFKEHTGKTPLEYRKQRRPSQKTHENEKALDFPLKK
jgi:AraC-like DNA-binding protein